MSFIKGFFNLFSYSILILFPIFHMMKLDFGKVT